MRKYKLGFFVALVAVMLCTTCAFAGEVPATELPDYGAMKDSFVNISADVKSDATDVPVVISALKSKLTENPNMAIVTDVLWTGEPTGFAVSGSMTATLTFEAAAGGGTKTVTVDFVAVAPELALKTSEMTAIKATDAANKTQSTLLSHVNSDLAVVAVNEPYQHALGTAPVLLAKPFTWGSPKYAQMGGTYVFTQTYQGITLNRTLNVAKIGANDPYVYVEHDDGILYCESGIRGSSDQKNWSAVTSGKDVPESWLGKTMYFFRPATAYAEASAIVSVHIPYRNDTPKTRLTLSTTTHSITVENVWDYNRCELSIDGSNWRSASGSTCVFDGLSANTRYTVRVREGASGGYMASKSTAVAVTTDKRLSSGVSFVINENGNIRNIDATANIYVSYGSSSMTGSLASNDLQKLVSAAKEYSGKNHIVNITLTARMLMEDDEPNEYHTVRISLPGNSLGSIEKYSDDFTVNVLSDGGNVSLQPGAFESSNSSLTVTIQTLNKKSNVSSSKLSWVRDQLDEGRSAIQVTVSPAKHGTATYQLPHVMNKTESVFDFNVYHVTENGDRSKVKSTFLAGTNMFVFRSAETGYFVLAKDGTGNGHVPFTDAANHWALPYISYCYQMGVFKGVSATAFAPETPISRSMIISLLARVDKDDVIYDTSSVALPYKDVPADAWYAASLRWAGIGKLMRPQADATKFGPNESMTREDLAYTISQYLTFKGLAPSGYRKYVYKDAAKISPWAADAINMVTDTGIMAGSTKDTFNPKGFVTRAEMATIMYRICSLR